MVCYLSQNVTTYGFIICDIRKDIINKSSRMCRYYGWMNDVWQELLREKEIDIISNRSARVMVQKVDVEISKDKDLFIRHSWNRQNFLQVFTEGIKIFGYEFVRSLSQNCSQCFKFNNKLCHEDMF